jgi:hypothetical protein
MDRIQRVFRFSCVALGILGGAFIVYGLVAGMTGQTWKPLEDVAEPLSACLTVVGAVITAGSIYMFAGAPSHPPDPISREATAPFVIVSGVVALAILGRTGSLPPIVVNGFSMMAIAGGLLRVQPRPAGW